MSAHLGLSESLYLLFCFQIYPALQHPTESCNIEDAQMPPLQYISPSGVEVVLAAV